MNWQIKVLLLEQVKLHKIMKTSKTKDRPNTKKNRKIRITRPYLWVISLITYHRTPWFLIQKCKVSKNMKKWFIKSIVRVMQNKIRRKLLKISSFAVTSTKWISHYSTVIWIRNISAKSVYQTIYITGMTMWKQYLMSIHCSEWKMMITCLSLQDLSKI